LDPFLALNILITFLANLRLSLQRANKTQAAANCHEILEKRKSLTAIGYQDFGTLCEKLWDFGYVYWDCGEALLHCTLWPWQARCKKCKSPFEMWDVEKSQAWHKF